MFLSHNVWILSLGSIKQRATNNEASNNIVPFFSFSKCWSILNESKKLTALGNAISADIKVLIPLEHRFHVINLIAYFLFLTLDWVTDLK